MTLLADRLKELHVDALSDMRRGIEKEGLRITPDGQLAQTPHWPELGSALTHPHITTDFSESQLELVTGPHRSTADCLDELTAIHGVVLAALAPHGGEQMWAASMPCDLPPDPLIPIGHYGSANVGQAKTVYRRGLSHRYGPRMQTISGIHYNWSFPGLDDASAFALIRNFRRHSFLLLYLFGASPAVPASFVQGLDHGLEALGPDTFGLPWATSLRMGRLGYQSDAQASLAVSYNDLEGYAGSLETALTQPYPPYEQIGVGDLRSGFRQLSTSLLQIENEFYSTIRPKRVIHSGERPLHALRERGVEYVEVRCMDINPLMPLGIDDATARFLDVFLLHCLLSDSPPDSPSEIAALARNQQLTATRGREPGLRLERGDGLVALVSWAAELLEQCQPLAQHLADTLNDVRWTEAWQRAHQGLREPHNLPSAQVLNLMASDHGFSHTSFVRERTRINTQCLLDAAPHGESLAAWRQMASKSHDEQRKLEASDSMPFDIYLHEYLQASRLTPRSTRHRQRTAQG